MEALKFVLKCTLFTMLLIVFMQVKMGNRTVESYAVHWLKTSPTSQYLQSAAAGGAMALRNLARSAGEAAQSTVDGFNEGAHQKAVR